MNLVVPLAGLVQGAWSLKSSNRILILVDGRIHLYFLDESPPRPIQCLDEIISVHPDDGDQILAVTSSGVLYSVNIKEDTASEVSGCPVSQFSQVSGSCPPHCSLLDSRGRVWARGSPPQVGLVTASDDFTQLRISPGCEVTQMVTGADFTAVIVRRRRAGDTEELSPLDTPDNDPEDVNHEDLGPVCPLGLQVSSQSISPKHSNQNESKVDDGVKINDIELDMVDGPSLSRQSSAVTQVMGQVSHIGRSVWSNSMSLLSLASFSSQDTPVKEESSDTDTESSGHNASSMSALVKSQSEPPGQGPPKSRPRRLSDTSSSRLGLSLGAVSDLAREGERLASAAVWTWGAGKRGQLGQGDTLARNNPCQVHLPGIESRVVKLSAGGHHLMAVTDTGQVWGWGDNTGGQAVYTDIGCLVTAPHPVVLQAGEMARDIACHGHVSVLLTNNLRCYVFGNIAGRSHVRMQVVDIASDLDISKTIIPSSLFMTDSGCVISCYLSDNHYREICHQEIVILRKISQVLGLLKNLSSPKSPNTHLDLVRERMTSFRHLVTTCSDITVTMGRGWQLSGLLSNIKQVLYSLSRLNSSVGNCIAVDLLLLDNHYQSLVPNIVTLLSVEFNIPSSQIEGQLELEHLLILCGTKILEPYLNCLKDIQLTLGGSNQDFLGGSISLVSKTLKKFEKEVTSAKNTKSFFQTTGGALLMDLSRPQRRKILDSHGQRINLEGAWANHWMVLFSDTFIIQSGNNVQTHKLETVWPSLGDQRNTKYKMLLTTPEETLTIHFSVLADRTHWFKEFNKYIKETLAWNRQNSIDDDDRPQSVANIDLVGQENFQDAPLIRKAEFTWTKGEMKECTYDGFWIQGKANGIGKMTYRDGSIHEGDWKNGKREGKGTLTRNKIFAGADGGYSKMVGVWEKGSMMGQGELTDFKGNVYTGDIVDGRPHGHGTKRMGKFDASKFYIGAWERGVKHGYGVMEENGEKYLGLWKDDVRQGPGCVVNVDGIFYQGNFLNNKLMGTGIMVFDDGAKYEGEFSGFGKFSGKGVLYTDNRKYEGTFSGNYSDSMKFNGEITILKNPADCDVVKPKFIIPHDDKWRDIFDKWNRQVGADPSNVWTKIAFVIGATKSPEQIKDCLGIFPKAGQAEPLVFEDLEFIENYLKEAFQSKLHPFGTLLNHLVDAYRASYEGIKTNSNNFLLQHALRVNCLSYLAFSKVTFSRNCFPSCTECTLLSGQCSQRYPRTIHTIQTPIV